MDSKLIIKLNKGMDVFWTDPEGETSGVYKVIEFDDTYPYDEDTVVVISNGYTEAEVYLHELTKLKPTQLSQED